MRYLIAALFLATALQADANDADAVFRVRTATAMATAFAVDKSHVVTCFHVVKGETEITVETRADHWAKCAVERTDEDDDLALLKVAEAVHDTLGISGDESGRADAYGSPNGVAIKHFDVVINSEMGKGLSEKIDFGCSGGPIVQSHKVIGVQQGIMCVKDKTGTIVFKLGMFAYVKGDVVRKFLERGK